MFKICCWHGNFSWYDTGHTQNVIEIEKGVTEWNSVRKTKVMKINNEEDKYWQENRADRCVYRVAMGSEKETDEVLCTERCV